MFKKTFCLLILSTALISADEAAGSALEILAQKSKLQELDLATLSKNSKSGENSFMLGNLGIRHENGFRGFYTPYLSTPLSQGDMYIQGALCHVAYYTDAIITTVRAGPYYGLQTVSDYYGNVIDYNNFYFIDYPAYGGWVFRHEYEDCTIITGQTQLIMSK